MRHHLKHNLWRPESTVLFVGYQSGGTLGAQLLEGAKAIKLFGEEIEVKARIAQMDGISGHADRNRLMGWLKGMNPRPAQVFVNHGEDTVCDEFAADVTRELGIPAEAPYNGAVYEIGNTVQLVGVGNKQRLAKKPAPINTVYDRLMAAYRRLGALIEKSRGRANKDLARLADQIESVYDKWK